MKIISKILLLAVFLLFGCNSDEEKECVKTIQEPYFNFINNQISVSYYDKVVPCDYPDPAEQPPIEDTDVLDNFTYEVISFIYTPDTGNNTSRLQFEIKLNNPNNYSITGVPLLTTNADGVQVTGSYSNNASSPCFEIGANSNCILIYDKEDELNLNLGFINSIELIDVKYLLTD